ncbi:chloride channel protein [Sandaracinus amylolyticus]|uniref:Chloride channel protein n=1 Tax=Sandaracinus amylolyticus TaxID=927083 RepID=A0A0F6W248_9BACT|nr:chloride channel protein [Sandaracinus amylolyticus]AKF05358.1 Chloride channel protein [Sandaracinus amylolyticus]
MSRWDHARERARFAIAVVITSALAAGVAVVVRGGIERTSELLFGEREVVAAFRTLPAWAALVAPALGALLGGLIASAAAARLPASHGVGDVMESVVLGRGRVSLRAALAKTISSMCAIVSGGSLGREGPLIQVGAALGGACGGVLGMSPSRTRILLATGTAAGFAAAYNTPIAATLFVIEIVTGVVALEVVVPVVVGAALATAISRITLGEMPFYGLRDYALVTPQQLASSIVLGPLGGLAGVLFMQMLSGGEALFARVKLPRALRAGLGGLIVGVIAIELPAVTGNGAEAIRELLDGRVVGLALLALLVAKPLATTASVSSGSAGGVFTPSMFLGASLGAVIASLLATGGIDAEREAFVGSFALIGMAAVVAATTHAPLMATVLAFEMSGDYALVLPLLAATSLATATARVMRRESIYAAEMRRKGVPWDGSLAHRLARAVHARDVLEQALVLPREMPLSEVHAELSARAARVAYATVDEGHVVAVDFRTLASADTRSGTLGEAGAKVDPITPDDDLPRMSERLWDAEWGELPVVDARGEVLGIVTRRGLLGAMDRELLQRDLLLTRMTWSDAEPGRLIELPRGHRIGAIDAPEELVGHVLDPIAVRRDLGLWVVAVRTGGARAPWRDSYESGAVVAGDRWLAMGPREAFEQLGQRTTRLPAA